MYRSREAVDARHSGACPGIARALAPAALSLAVVWPALADEAGKAASGADRQAMIEEALSAAPPQLRDKVEVRDLEGNLLREGEGAFTCFPAPPDIAGPMCMDEPWLAWMDAWMNQEPFQAERIGLSYMLAGDAPDAGASNINPFDSEPTPDNDWVVEGPHIMIIVPDEALLEGLPTSPDTGGPYVMWKGTPYAHIMMPVDERPEQRSIPGS